MQGGRQCESLLASRGSPASLTPSPGTALATILFCTSTIDLKGRKHDDHKNGLSANERKQRS